MSACYAPPKRNLQLCRLFVLHLFIYFILPATSLMAEGSVDFVNYPGYRLFMDTRDSQQIKVYARVGEFINVGASHVGIKGGYIRVYRPDGTLVVEFNDTGAHAGEAIINNHIEELNGPTGGGTTNGLGYVPGVVAVDQEGVWTVRFDYPDFELVPFPNLFNNAPWNRVIDQPFSQRVILAWDVTVTIGAAGNEGGVPVEGRVFTNEYISLLNNNGFTTSPTFWVLTITGYLYQVNFVDTDPFRFPISSNSVGIVEGSTLQPTYASHSEANYIRSADVPSWLAGMLYLYEPQAKDYGDQIINNKIFFNPPDTTMPATAMVTDIYRNETYTTWLYSPPIVPQIDNTSFMPLDSLMEGCDTNTMLVGVGGYFTFSSNVQGLGFLHLDLNNDGDFADSVDRIIQEFIQAGTDSIFWDGLNGMGDTIGADPSFTFNYQLDIRVGEVHIAVTDVENNNGGIYIILHDDTTFTHEDSLFYYDHSPVGGPVSGGVAPGQPPLPTTIPYTYSGGVGNEKFLDQWTYQEFSGTPQSMTISIVNTCLTCDSLSRPQIAVSIPDSILRCEGDTLQLQVANSNTTGVHLPLTWLLVDTNGTVLDSVQLSDTIAQTTLSIAPLDLTHSGAYQLILRSAIDCADTVAFQLNVAPVPLLGSVQMNGTTCMGQATMLQAINTVVGIDSLFYTWWGPLGSIAMGSVAGSDTISLILSNTQVIHEGAYQLVVTSEAGCTSDTLDGSLVVLPVPQIVGLTNDTTLCEGDTLVLRAINNVSGVGDITYIWTGSNGLIYQQTTGEMGPFTLPLGPLTTADTGIYSLQLAAANGCQSVADTVQLGLFLQPQITNISGGGNYCMGTIATLSAQNSVGGIGAVSWEWIGPNGFYQSGVAGDTATYTLQLSLDSVTQAGTYILVLTSAQGCVSDTASVLLNVLPTPIAVDVQGAGQYCLGTPVVLSAANAVAGIDSITYSWTGPNGFSFQSTTGAFGPFLVDLGLIDGDKVGLYELTLTANNGCSSGPYVLSVDTLPGLSISQIAGGGTYCEGSDIVLSAQMVPVSGVNTVTYTWTGPNGLTYTDSIMGTGPFDWAIPNAQLTHSGTYCLSLQADNGCTTLGPTCTDIVVQPTPTFSISTTDTVTCADSVALIAIVAGVGATDEWMLNWTGPNGFFAAQTGVGPVTVTQWIAPLPQGGGTGTYIASVTTGGGCTSQLDTVIVEWQPYLMITNLNGGGNYCTEDTIRLSANAMLTQQAGNAQHFTLEVGSTWASVGSQICVDVKAYNFTDIYAMQFSMSWDSTALQLDSLTNFQLPWLNASSFNVASSGHLVLAWIDLDLLGVTLPDGATLFQMCFTVMDSAQVNFGSWPVPVEIADANGVLTNTSFISGQVHIGMPPLVDCHWIAPNGTMYTQSCSVQGPFEFSVPADTDLSGTWCFTLSGNSICAPVDTVCTEVIVFPTPAIADLDSVMFNCSDTLLLSGQSSNLPAGQSVSYTWDGPSGFSYTGMADAPGPYEAVVTGQPLAPPGTYCLTLEHAAGGCTSPTVCTQVINCIEPQIDVVGDSTIALCEGVDATFCAQLTTNGLDSVTFQWVNATGVPLSGGTSLSDTLLCLSLPQVAVGQSGTIYLSVVGWPGGATLQQQFELIVHPTPVPVAPSANQPCMGDSLLLNAANGANGMGMVSYTWTGPNGYSYTGSANWAGPFSASMVAADSTAVGSYCIQLTSLAGCTSDTACVSVQLAPQPQLTELSGSGTYCQGDTAILSAYLNLNGLSGTYTWTLPNGDMVHGQLFSTDTVALSINGVVPGMTGAYTLQAWSEDGCAADPITFYLNSYPVESISLSANTTQLCTADTLILTAEGQFAGIAWYWYRVDANGQLELLTNTSEPNWMLYPGVPGTYVVIGQDTNGCRTNASAALLIEGAGEPDAQDDLVDGVYNGITIVDVLQNDGAPDGVGTLVVLTPPANGTASFDANGQVIYEPQPNFFGTDQLEYELCSKVCPEMCDQAWVQINVVPNECEVPNVLTPNGDGANDQLIIPCLEGDCCTQNTLRIFNRWGDEVYSASPYQNDWEGTWNNQPLPAGTYFYVLQLDAEGTRIIQGFITIVR